VSGAVGEAAAGLAILESRLGGGTAAAREHLERRFLYPEPHLELGARLSGIASAAIDISDGTAGDIGKLARASGCGARIEVSRLFLSRPLLECAGPGAARDFALGGGDDYELCFTVPPGRLPQLAAHVPVARWPYHDVGVLTDTGTIEFIAGGKIVQTVSTGYDHFGR
jgi:thiamine-monophosphate kinase